MRYDAYVTYKAKLLRDRWDPRDLDAARQFAPYMGTGDRVRVTGPMGTRTGTIGVTTGWRPAFLLMRRAGARGSSDVLGADDRIVGIKWAGTRRYVDVVHVGSWEIVPVSDPRWAEQAVDRGSK